MMIQTEITADHERSLRDQAITAGQPGSVLHDFEMLLDFLNCPEWSRETAPSCFVLLAARSGG
jgi:hypothetical protein